MTQPLLYGAWVSRKDFIPVGYESHAEEGLRILNSTLKVKKEHDTRCYSVYTVMFRLGYVRVIYNRDNTYNVEYWQAGKFSKYQQDFINQAEMKSAIKIYSYEWN